MSKLKTPLLGLDARGTLGDALTFQKKGQDTIVRTKPIPAYRYTLLQAYQRWLYEDYAYLWTQQSGATKQSYTTTGGRHHLTGFQYWMKYHLANLPDIAGMWYLDEKIGAVAYDKSRNANNGVITGASPTTGLIDGAFLFDGLNDKVVVPYHPSLDTPILSFELFLCPKSINITQILVDYRPPTLGNFGFLLQLQAVNTIRFRVADGGASVVDSIITLVADRWYHFCVNYDQVNMSIYINGAFDNSKLENLTMTPPTAPLVIGQRADQTDTHPTDAILDHIIYRNRVLDPTEIKRHSERRYP